MERKKRILGVSAVTIFIGLLLVAIKFYLGYPYIDQLPGYPEFSYAPESLRTQVLAADRKARFNPTANNIGRLGMVYHSGAYYERAAICYQLALDKNSNKWLWSYYLGHINLEMGELEQAMENFSLVLDKDPHNYPAMFYMGEIFQNQGQTDRAGEMFNKIVAAEAFVPDKKYAERDVYFPLRTYALFGLSRIYMESNRLDKAEMTLLEIVDDQMAFGPAYRMLGNIYNLKGDMALSSKYTIRANDLSPYSPPVDFLIDNIALISRSDQYLLKPIEEAFRNLNFEWGLKLCDQGLKYIPENKYLISKAVFGYLLTGNGDKALPFLDDHIKHFGDDFIELMNIADLLYNNNFYPQAMNYFQQAQKLEPSDSKLALWLSNRGMIEPAVKLLNEQLEKEPGNDKILYDAVHMLLNMGEKKMMMTYLDRLEKLSPDSPRLKLLAGMIEEKEGNTEEAIFIYEEIFRIEPEDLVVVKALANLYIRQRSWERAINHFRIALRSHPNEPFLLEGLGRLLVTSPDQALRDIDDGIEYSERAYINFRSPFPTKISAGINLAAAYHEKGDSKKSVHFMNNTVGLARKMNVSKDYIDYLEDLLSKYSITEK
jgi:tetratricopeptide (TPR) repeat protein